MKRWWIAGGLVVGGLLLAWLMESVTYITTVHIQYTGRPSSLQGKMLETEAQIMRTEFIRSRVAGSFSSAEKALLRAAVNPVPPLIVELNHNDSTFAVAVIDPRAEVAGFLADRYVSEYFRYLKTTNGAVDPAEVKQILGTIQTRLRGEIETAKAASEAHRQTHANEASTELEETVATKELALRETETRLTALAAVSQIVYEVPFRRLGSETSTLNRFQLVIRGLSDAAANSGTARP